MSGISLAVQLLRALPRKRSWTDEEDAQLRQALAAGMTYRDAGAALGRTRDAVSDRLRVLRGEGLRSSGAPRPAGGS